MNRQDLITLILPGMIDAAKNVPEFKHRSEVQIEAAIRQDIITTVSDHELQGMFDKQRAAGIITDADLRLLERAATLARIAAKQRDRDEQTEREERQYFAVAVEQLRIANNEANYRIVRDSHIRFNGVGLSWRNIDEIKQLVEQGQFAFAPARIEDQQRWNHDDRLQIAEQIVDGLRGQFVKPILGYHDFQNEVFGQPNYALRENPEQNRARNIQRLAQLPIEHLQQLLAVHQHNQQAKQQAAQPRQRQQFTSGFPPLPQENQHGEKIDRVYLLRISERDLDLYKKLLSKHGSANVTVRLQGRG
jgi:hypothetical protein